MKFSIVITTYNRLPLLRRAVESALNQTLPCEIAIADDASSDGTQEYIRSLGDRVVYHRNSVNMGHSATVNAGVAIAQGDWIKLVDDDDYLAPECIEKMAEAIALCPQAVICSCQALQVDVNGKIIGTKKRVTGEAFYVRQEDIHYGMLLEILPFGTPIQVAFQKDAFLKSGGWESAFDVNYDDINSWLKIAQYGDAVFINQYLTYRMLWSGSCNKNIPLQQRWEMNVLIKEKIYSLVSAKYQTFLPTLQSIKYYLRLHWFLVGLKQREPLAALKLAGKALFSPKAWSLFLRIIYTKKLNPSDRHIPLDIK
ncbi:MAG: glycosyltransferase family 2 protein [Xenococcaceae cyanobacterium]